MGSGGHADVGNVAVGEGEEEHDEDVGGVRAEPHGQVPVVGISIAEDEEGDKQDPKERGGKGHGHADAAGARPGHFLGCEPAQVVAHVEQDEAADRDEVVVGPGRVLFGID